MHKYEMHAHTAEMGSCGKVCAAEMVNSYFSGGYSGIVVTDHYQAGFFEEKRNMDWNSAVDEYLMGYNAACAAAKSLDFSIFLGMEIRFSENPNDYLVYGVSAEFLYSNPRLYNLRAADFKKLADKNNLLIFQAHPFRQRMIPTPQYVHGIEVFNGNPRHDSKNEQALQLALDKGLLKIEGSDFHQYEDLMQGGIITAEKIRDNKQLIEALTKENFKLIRTKL